MWEGILASRRAVEREFAARGRSHIRWLLLRCLLRMRNSVVDFQPIERCRLVWVEPEFSDLVTEEFALFWMIVETACLPLVSPTFNFFRRFILAGLIQPIDYLHVAR